MTLQPGWVAEHLAPKITRREINDASEHSRICRDAMQLHQWETALDSGHKLLSFIEKAKDMHAAKMKAKRARKLARCG